MNYYRIGELMTNAYNMNTDTLSILFEYCGDINKSIEKQNIDDKISIHYYGRLKMYAYCCSCDNNILKRNSVYGHVRTWLHSNSQIDHDFINCKKCRVKYNFSKLK